MTPNGGGGGIIKRSPAMNITPNGHCYAAALENDGGLLTISANSSRMEAASNAAGEDLKDFKRKILPHTGSHHPHQHRHHYNENGAQDHQQIENVNPFFVFRFTELCPGP